MRKRITKIICFMVVAVFVLAAAVFSACSKEFKATPLKGNIFAGEVESNGGFAVKKGEYVYFINGSEDNSANNDWGNPVRGSIMRIHEDDLAALNYSKVDVVVPLIAYSGNTSAPNYGIFIYGDYIYYSTPAVTVDSDGEVEYEKLDFRRTKLDGTGTSNDPIFTYSTSTLQYTFLEDNGTVYLVYVATGENLYGTSYTNLHSVNCSTGKNTLLAYNVKSVLFDSVNVGNPYIYYTMQVPKLGDGSEESSYNQIYRVSAGETERNTYDFTAVEDYDGEKDPVYINCGDLILDGRGKTNDFTQFNAGYVNSETKAPEINYSARTYTLVSYERGHLFVTRTATNDTTPTLFDIKDEDITTAGDKVVPLDDPAETAALQKNATEVAQYNFLYKANGDLEDFVFSEDSEGLEIIKMKEGKLPSPDGGDLTPDDPEDYHITTDGTPKILYIDEANKYVYYSTASGSYNFRRVKYDGQYNDYEDLEDDGKNEEYTEIGILDLAADNSWYAPEFIDGQILFPTATDNMSNYTYVMAFDLRSGSGDTVKTNTEIKELNELFESIDGTDGKIGELAEDLSDTTRNLAGALRYAFYTRSSDKIHEIDEQFSERVEDYADDDYTSGYNELTLTKVDEFVKAEGDWATFKDKTRTVNGETVYSNARDYYYCLLGRMKSADVKAYAETLASAYLQKAPDLEPGWYEAMSAGARAGMIIGIIAGVLLLIAAGALIAGFALRAKAKPEEEKRRRYKVDTTDDKDIDVYSDEQSDNADNGGEDAASDGADGGISEEDGENAPSDADTADDRE